LKLLQKGINDKFKESKEHINRMITVLSEDLDMIKEESETEEISPRKCEIQKIKPQKTQGDIEPMQTETLEDDREDIMSFAKVIQEDEQSLKHNEVDE
jgi:hypothetical protein